MLVANSSVGLLPVVTVLGGVTVKSDILGTIRDELSSGEQLPELSVFISSMESSCDGIDLTPII